MIKVEGCPNVGVCLLGEEPYGFLIEKFRRSDELGWRTLKVIYANTDLVKQCELKNPGICPAVRIAQAVSSSRR